MKIEVCQSQPGLRTMKKSMSIIQNQGKTWMAYYVFPILMDLGNIGILLRQKGVDLGTPAAGASQWL